MRHVLSAVAAAVALAGCTAEPSAVEPGPVTPEKIEVVARDHLPEPDRAAETEPDGSDPRGSIAVRLVHGAEHVDVVVGPGRSEPVSRACGVAECDEVETDVEGATMTLVWQEVVPEEDPGIIVLVLTRADEFSLVRWGGDITVTGDPRALDLDVPVADAAELLEDERLRLDVP